MFKGKLVYRSWSELPAEVLKLVASEIINDFFSLTPYVPRTWDQQNKYYAHNLWLMLSAAEELQALQLVCRLWELALSNHGFWAQAIDMLDRAHQHVLSEFERQSPFTIFQTIVNTCCIPCLFNMTSSTLSPAKHQVRTAHLGWVSTCAIHRRDHFCAVCLQDDFAPRVTRSWHDVDQFGRWRPPGLSFNDDKHTWPHCFMTCWSCRKEELDKKLMRSFGSNVGQFAVDSIIPVLYFTFVRSGRGDIKGLTASIEDRLWLRENTRHDERMEQYRSNVLLNRIGSEKYELFQRMRAEQEERIAQGLETEPLSDNLHPHDVFDHKAREGLRNMALHDWAKLRIEEGFWIAPADFWYDDYSVIVQRLESAAGSGEAVAHPHEGFEETPEELRYPSSVHFGFVPPRGRLFNDCQLAFLRAFRLVLRPALGNCLRRLVAESKAFGFDACQAVLKVRTEDLLSSRYLLASENWLVDYDWEARYSADSPREESSPGFAASISTTSEGSGSGQGGSDGTDERSSPATTFRTTPSPSPEVNQQSLESNPPSTEPSCPPFTVSQTIVPSHTPSTIHAWPSPPPTSLLVTAPRPLECVPRIPTSLAFLGPSVRQLLDSSWQEIYTPLFDCSCSICQRTGTNANANVEDEYAKEEPLLQQIVHSGVDLSQQFIGQYKPREASDEELYDYDDEEEGDEFEDDEDGDDWVDYDTAVVQGPVWAELPSRPSPEVENISSPSLGMESPDDAQSEPTLEIFDDSPGSDGQFGKESLGSKSSSLVGGRRSRDLEDVDGATAEIVTSENGIGHGRKRLKS